MSTQDRIKSSKSRVEDLKSRILQVQHAKHDATLASQQSAKQQPVLNYVENIRCRNVLEGHFGKVYAMHWSTDGTSLVSASQDGKLIVWNALRGLKANSVPLRSAWVMSCAFEPTQQHLVASGGLDNTVSIYSVAQQNVGRANKELVGHDGYVSCCRFIDEETLVSSSGDSTCVLWNIETGKQISSYNDHGGDVMCVSLLPNQTANIFASASCDSTAKVYDLRTSACTHTFRGHESDVNSVNFLSNGFTIATGSDDSSCRVFDLRCLGEISCLRQEKDCSGITSIQFSLSGRFLAAGYDDSQALIWDTLGEGSRPVQELKQNNRAASAGLTAHASRVSCLGINLTGNAICTGSWDTTLKIWA